MPTPSPAPARVRRLTGAQAQLVRVYYGVLALVVTVALVAQFFVTLEMTVPSTGTRLIRLVSFFTIQSNVLVCITSWALAVRSRPS